MDDDIRQYADGQQEPLAVRVIAFETDYVTRKVDGVEKQVPRDKVVLGRLGDPQYRQEMWISRLAGERCDSPRLWNELIKEPYEAWKRGEEMVQQGTPLAVLGFIAPKMIQQYRLLNIHTAEDLAVIEDGDLARLGLEGRKHRDQARKYVEAANSETAQIAAKQRAQDDVIAQQAAQIEELMALLADKTKPAPKNKEPTQKAAA